jgi:hypothetical protein
MAAAGTSRRTPPMAPTSWVTVSWVATASSSSVESTPAGPTLEDPGLGDHHPDRLKDPLGPPEAPSLPRHKVSTVGWKPWSVRASPQATFQARFHRSWMAASRSDNPANACTTMTVATWSAGTNGRPRPEGNKSANNSSGNKSLRCRPKSHTPSPHRPGGGTAPPHPAARHDWDQCPLGLPRFDGQGWWLGQATCVRASWSVVSNSSGVM